MDSSDADTISHVVWALIYLSEVVSSVPTLELEGYSFLGLGKIGLKGVIAKGYEVSFWSDENVPKINRGDSFTYLWIY